MKKRQDLVKGGIMLLSMSAIFILLSIFVFSVSEPEGPNTVTVSNSGRYQNNSIPYTLQAQAGNVSALVIDQKRTTEAWQGYYGNVTGTITLDDAGNYTLYDWSLPDPTGEVYASTGNNVVWSNIYCMNVSPLRNVSGTVPGGVVYNINGSQIELNYGINSTDKDGLNETFIDTYNSVTGFRTGSVQIDVTKGCSLAHPYASEAYDPNSWQELLLSDNSSLIFTSLLRDNAGSYQTGGLADFEMLVLENGHVGQEAITTPYYFFVELA